MTKTTRLNQTGSILRLDRGKKAVFMMLFALFSTFLAQSQCALTWNTQPLKFQRICIPFSTLTPRLQVAAVTCPGGNLSYQWQKRRPVSIGGTGLWDDISPFAAGYIGGNTPTLDITVADSITGGASYYEYRNVVISTGGINPCISGGSTACPYQSDTSNVSKIVGVRKPIVKYLTALDTTVCQYVGGLNPDQTYTLKARIIGVSNFDTLKYTWRTVNMPGFVHSDLSAHPNYTGWITTGFPSVFSSPPDSGTLIRTLTLNNANNTPLILGWDQSRFYLEINSPTCGLSDTNTVPKRKLTVNPVPNVTIITPNKSICENDAFTLSYNVTNARHDTMRAGPVSWTIRVSGDAQLKALLIAADTTGTGNVNKTISIPASHGLSVGIHIVNVSWILNTTDPGACQRLLAAAQITVNVYPKPFVEFLTPNPADTVICQGGSGLVKFKVSNATFNGNDIGWTVFVNDPSGILAPATLTGQGNKIIVNTIPTNLPIGQHVVTLTGINTSGTPSVCSGFVIGITTDTIKVLPTPDATMNTTVTIDKCFGFSKDSFVVVVSNAVYPVGPVNLDWVINYTDPTGTIVGAFTGTGNGSFKFVTSNTLPLGTNTITLNTITLVSPNATLGVIPTCSKTLIGQSKSYRVYPTPTASFSRNGMDSACEGSTPPSISLNVSGAQFTPNPALAWKVASSGKFWAAASGSIDTASVSLTASFIQGGSGNGSFNFTPPSTLAPGMYTLYLDTISLTNTPKCFSILKDTFVWHIFPQPIATIIGTNMLDSICEGSTVNYSIAVSNVYYQPFSKNLKWTLNYSNGLGGTIGASPKIGIGAAVLGAFVTSSGLTTGNRSLELLDITNNTDGCFNDLPGTEVTNTKLTRRIYPKPKATISTATINICEGSATSFTVAITNAVKQPGNVNQPWSLNTIGTFEGAAAGSPSVSSTALTFPTTGAGNTTTTVTVPNTLPAGRYIFTLGNPQLTVTPLNCVGSTGSPSQIVINVYPKPTLLVTPAIDSTCQGISRAYTVQVGNAYYEPNSGPINWRIRYFNQVGAGSAPSNPNGSGVITGTGNNTTVYNSAVINIAGIYEFRVDSLSNTTNVCKYNTKDTFRLIVKQRPSLTILAFDSEVCFRTRATVTYKVDSVAVGQAWSFTYTAINTSPGGTKTISGIGPKASAMFVTDSFTTSGAGTISFSPIMLTAVGGCASTKTLPSINLNVAYVPDVTSNTTNGTGIICGNAASGTSTVQFNITTTNMIVGSVTKNWKITYDIIGTQDTSLVSGSQIFKRLGLTFTGTGNGAFTFTSPHQTYNGTSADAGIADIRRMVIRKIEFTGVSPLNCSNMNIADSITMFTVNPRPRFVFTKLNADHVCVTSPVITGYNIFGFKAGDVGTFSWNGTNPTTSPNNVNISGPSIISGSITTVNTTFPGLSTQTVTNVTNSTTGCQAILIPQPKDTTIVDPPSLPGTLNGNATVCEGNNSGTLYLTGTIVGKVQYWEYSENDGFTWLQFANTDTFYRYTNASLTRRWRVVVKNLTCPINRSNEVIVFVHPQPKVQITNYTSGLCVGDSIRFTISITGVPTNHTWKFGYTKSGFSSNNGNATLTGRGSGNFTYTFGGMTANALTGLIQLGNINNDTTNCNNNYASSGSHLMTIIVGSNSVAGAIQLVGFPNVTLPVTVCKGSTVKLKYIGAGNVLVWYNSNSTSGAFPNGWDSITSTSTTQTYYVIDTTTHFRVKVKFGSCAAVVNSTNQTVNVRSLPTASITGSDTICEKGTFTWTPVLKGDINLSVALTWLEGSTGKSGTFSLGSNPPTSVTPSTVTTSVLTTTTSVILQSVQYTTAPACPQLLYTNAIATATVNPEPTATINSVTTPVCQGSTSPISFSVAGVASSTTWKLNYKVGGVRQTPITGTGAGTFTVNTPALNTAGNVTVQFDTIFTTNIRTNCFGILTSGLIFTAAVIKVDATTTPGFVGDSITICKGGRATIVFTPGNGIITKWNISATGATGFYASQSSTSNSFYMSNIQSFTWFTASSKNGVCPEVTTAPVLVRTRELPGATIITGSTTVCSGSMATLTIQVGGTFGNSWTIDYLEGATSKTKTGTGDGNFTITTDALTSNTDITLQRITMNNTTTSVNPSCGPIVLTSTATVNVNPNPSATLNTVQTPVCQSSTSNSNFTITVAGVPTGQGWSLTYTLNAGSPVTVGNAGSGTFTFPLTLSTAGTVTLSLTSITNTGATPNCVTALSGQTKDIIVDATTVAGSITNSAASVVCIGSNNGSLSYSGGNGSIVRWEFSDDNGANWISTTTTSNTFNWSNLAKSTRYRVVVKNGSCLDATSAFSEIVVRPLPTATISGSQNVCQGDSAQLTITVSNRFSNPWAVTLLEGTTQRVITTPTFYTRALNGTTDITLQSIVLTHTPANNNPGGCPNTISSTATVTVTPMPNATINFATTPICIGGTSNVTFSVNNVSTGQAWRIDFMEAGISRSTTGSGPGTFTISTLALNTAGTNVITFNSITTTSSSPNCTRNLTGQSLNIMVDALSVPGTVSSDQTVCKGSNSGMVSVTGHNGSVVRWEYSSNGGSSWTTIANTTNSVAFSNLTSTRLYRVWTKNSACSEIVSSNVVTITINELPKASISITSGNNPICANTKGTYTVTTTNTYGQPWSLNVIEGATSRTLNGTGDVTVDFETSSNLSSNTTVALVSIATNGSPSCGPNTISGNVTFTVTPRPSVTLNSVVTPVCQGASTFAIFQITTSNIAAGVGFAVTYSVGTTTGLTFTNTGSGTFTVSTSTPALNTAGTVAVTLTDITTTGLSPNCNTTPSSATRNIVVDATSVAGTVSSDQTVCKGANTGSVSVAGHNGAVVRWEYSTNSGASWTAVSNTTTSLTFTNLTTTTQYRVWTKNNTCSEIVSSNVVTITVNELPTASISIKGGNSPICANTKGTYTITTLNTFGQTWSLKVIEGSTSRTVTGTGNTTVDFTTDSIYKSNFTVALVSIATTGSPSCGPNTISGNVTFTVTPRPSVTLNSVVTPVCQGASTFAIFQITTSNIAAGVGFAVTYSVGTTTGLTFTNTGSGTFTVSTSTPALNTAGTVAVTLTDITTTGLSPNCNTTPSGATRNIVVDATSVAGTVSSDQTVCKGANTGSVSVAGHNGAVVRWEYSTNSGASWTAVSNTTTSLTFTNLTTTTQYRVWTKNNTCSEIVSSNVVTITVNELPTASISITSGNNPICEGTNGTYTITTSNTFGQTWSLKVIEGATARTLTGTGNGSFDFTTSSVLNSNIVISLVSIATTGTPSCGPNTISGDVTFTVIPLPTATIDMVITPVCQGNMSKVQFTVSNVATGQGWSLSYTEAGTSKTTTGNGPGTYTVSTSSLNTVGKNAITFNSITVTSTTPNCTKSLTATDTIMVDATTVAGTISGKATVCKGSNSGTLNYSGGNGAIVRWEYSINGGSTWSATGTKATSYSYINLTQTTNYRVVVKNSACLEAISAPDTITVREQPYATISGSTTICQSSSIGLTVAVSNTFGNPWTITYLEGTSTLTFTGSGDGNKTLTTSNLSATSDITLQSIQLTHAGTSSNPACGPNGLSSTATVNVTPLPTATLNNVITPICQGNTSAFEFTVSNIATGQGWSMSYTEGTTSKTTTGNGPGTYKVSTSALSAGTVTITLNSISTTGLATNCTRNLTAQTLDITVNPTTTVGALGTDVTVCKNLNSGSLTYNVGSSNGAVVRWESSTLSSSGPWTSISNTTNTQAYINISQTTFYRVVVKSGTCAEKESNVITVSVQEIPVAFVGGSSAICAGNTATLSISISNVAAGQRSILTYLEGTTSKTVNIFGASGSITTSILNTNTDISLVSVTSIDTTISATFRKGCFNSTLTSTATVNVNALPTATLTSVGGPICQGSSTTYTVTVANVPTGQGWSLTGTIEGVSIAPAPSGTGSGTFTFSTPVLNTPPAATVAFTLITNTTTGCVRSLTESRNITVNATTTIGTIAADATVCKGSNAGSVDYTSGGTNGSILRWEYSTVSPATAFNGIFNTAASQTYSNLTATTFYRAIVKNGVCNEVASNVVTITVRDLPNATIAGNNTICEGSSSNFTITVTNTFGQTFKVYYLIGSKLDSLVQTGDGTYTINSGVLTNTVDVTLISIKQVSGTPQCSQAIIGTITITVNELPRASYTSVPNSLCQGSTINFTIDVSKVKTTQSWSLSYTVNAPSSSAASSESKTGQGSGSVSITTSTKVLPTTSTLTLGTITNTSTGCATTLNDAKVITVDPTTVGGKLAISTKDTVCKGTNNGTLTLSGNTGAVVRWEFSTNNGSTWSTINSTSNSYSWSNLTQTTRFRAVVQSGVCNSANSRDTTILVRELPMATISSTTICAGNTASLTVTVTNTFGKAWTLTFVEGSTTRTLTGSGDGNFTLTTGSLNTTTTIALKSIQITSGTVLCGNTLSDVGTVTVNALPSASHDSAPSSVCHNNTVDFTINIDDVVVGQGWSINYRVNTPTTTGSTFTRSGTGPGNFTITTPIFTNTSATVRTDVIELISITNTTTGCTRTSSVTRSIDVFPASVGGTTAATNSTLCANTATTSDITVSGFVGKVVRWEYSDDNQATWTTYSNTATTITVSNLSKTREYRAVIVSGPCASANSTIVKITVIPTVDAVITGAPQICPGQTALFNVVVSNISANDNWSLLYRVNGTLQTALTGKGPGNFPLSVGPPATSAAGTIIVKLESITNTTFNCANTTLVSQAIATVHPNPIANFTVANSCKDSVAVFTNTSSIISGTIADFTWDFGDGTTSKTGNPTHAYTTTGNFNVKLKAVSAQGCSDEITKVITVNPRPVANFTFVNTCQNVAVTFTGTSTIASGSIKSFFWNFGDGGTSTAQSPTRSYAAAGTYTVTLTVVSDNGCASTKVQSITIWDLPEPNFVANPVCEGLAMNFVNTSSIGVGTMTYNWSFAGQGTSTLTNPSHTFTGFNSAFSVTLTATSNNGCIKTLVKPVTVWAKPIASFTVDSACFGDVSRFINTSTVPSPSTDFIQEWFWNFGDSTYSTGKDPIHTFSKAINWTVTVRATTNNGCVNTATGTAVVVPLPLATIVATDTMFCNGLSSTLTGTAGMAGYRWTTQGIVMKGDSLLGTGRTIVVTKQGWYKLVVTSFKNGCTSDADSMFITVWQLPVADAGRDTSIDKGQTVWLKGKGAGLKGTYQWSSTTDLYEDVNATKSTNGALQNVYSKPKQTISYQLLVTDMNGCQDIDSVTIIVRDEFVLKVHNVVTPNGDGKNDTWIIDNIEFYPEAEVAIFNRYGVEIYRKTGYNNEWDGTYKAPNGDDLPDGAYYYVITMKGGSDKVYKGAISVVRNAIK